MINILFTKSKNFQKRLHNYLDARKPNDLSKLMVVKKIIFADTISKVVEPVFNSNIDNLNFLEILIGIYGFAVQIYCDFSGYSDMAVGLGLILGINLPINFLKPYTSKSLGIVAT